MPHSLQLRPSVAEQFSVSNAIYLIIAAHILLPRHPTFNAKHALVSISLKNNLLDRLYRRSIWFGSATVDNEKVVSFAKSFARSRHT